MAAAATSGVLAQMARNFRGARSFYRGQEPTREIQVLGRLFQDRLESPGWNEAQIQSATRCHKDCLPNAGCLPCIQRSVVSLQRRTGFAWRPRPRDPMMEVFFELFKASGLKRQTQLTRCFNCRNSGRRDFGQFRLASHNDLQQLLARVSKFSSRRTSSSSSVESAGLHR